MIFIPLFLVGEEERSYHFYPVLDYEDETGVSGGGVFTILSRDPEADANISPDLLSLKLKGGVKGNYTLKMDMERQLEMGKYIFRLPVYFSNYPYTYAGQGNEFNDLEEKLSARQLSYHFAIIRRWERFHFGFTYKGRNFRFYDTPTVAQGDNAILGSAGGWSLGPGLIFEYDSRDNHYFPLHGVNISLSMQNYSNALRSDYDFDSYCLKTLGFFKISRLSVLACKLVGEGNMGEVPFQELADINEEIRGFSQGLIKDKFLTGFTAELRSFPFEMGFWARFGFVIFGECGEVGGNLQEFTLTGLHYSYGFGLRYLLNTAELYTIRYDLGISKTRSSSDFSAREFF